MHLPFNLEGLHDLLMRLQVLGSAASLVNKVPFQLRYTMSSLALLLKNLGILPGSII